MTRDTKVGLVVAGSFICLVAVVVATKFQGETAPAPAEVADAGSRDEAKEKERKEKSSKRKDGPRANAKTDSGPSQPGVRQTGLQEAGPLPPAPIKPDGGNPDVPGLPAPPPNLRFVETPSSSTPRDAVQEKMVGALQEQKLKEQKNLAMSAPSATELQPLPPVPMGSESVAQTGAQGGTPLPPVPPPSPPGLNADPAPKPPAPAPPPIPPPGPTPFPPAPPAFPPATADPMLPGSKVPPAPEPQPSAPLPAPGAQVPPTPPAPAVPPAAPVVPPPAPAGNLSQLGSPTTVPPAAVNSVPPLGPPPPAPAKTEIPAPAAPPAAAPPANPGSAPTPLGAPPAPMAPGLASPIPVGGVPQPPPSPLTPNSTPVVSPLGQGSMAANPEAPTRVPPIGAQPTPLGANTPPTPGTALVKIKETNITNHVCSADETSFTAISRNIWGDEKYGPALAQFNAAAQNKPLPGHTVLIPPISFLEQNFAAAIAGGTAGPLGAQRPVQSNSLGFPPKTADKGSDPMLPFNPNTIPRENFTRGPGPDAIGQKPAVKTPPAGRPAPKNGDGTKSYRVPTQGENIIDIARRTLGDSRRWPEIYRLNANVDPAYPIPGGTELHLPASAVVPAP